MSAQLLVHFRPRVANLVWAKGYIDPLATLRTTFQSGCGQFVKVVVVRIAVLETAFQKDFLSVIL